MALAVSSAASASSIVSAGPLTSITISPDLNCSVLHTGDASPEWFGNTACGTLVVDQSTATLYGPASIPAGGAASPRTALMPISQVGPTGTGTALDPFKIVTVAGLGVSGLTITQTDSYVVGQESYRTDVQISNSNLTPRSVRLYAAGDCYLQSSDYGYGRVDGSAIACTATSDQASRIEQLFPLTSGSSYMEAVYNIMWARIGAQLAGPNTCDCATFEDNAILLSWDVTVPAAGSATVSHLTTFSPLGFAPLSTSKTADSSTVGPGGTDGYTITIHNPNASPVVVNSITDTLPAGFAYAANSTTGATTANPAISGQTLTWNGTFSGPAGGDLTLHFTVTASGTPGTYFNNAGGDAGTVAVAPSGETAPITVQGVTHTLTVTKAGAGSGTVTSSPVGISCGATCSAQFVHGTVVTLTATAATGSSFSGWGGACSGTGTCTVSMDQDRAVTATFGLVGPPAPRVLKQGALTSLRALLPTGNKQKDTKIKQAIERLQQSLASKLWLDDSHLTQKGKKVFDREKQAVDKLRQIKNPPPTVASVINTLVAVDRALARTAIGEATTSGGRAKKLAEAEKEMQKASKEIAKGHPAQAIEHYGNAWKKAQQARK